ncbi:glucans biosynthesis glucosyltransferase MdoH [Leptospira sp. 2 VSF19]|uniref:Glucans biosynthesis glucosyltransferase H n=1 Tax=Leptospira soteropolitanensis TaxID=2950025 RepID=A0AAW5VPJ7_9LEPT|nr:glucans biosynthesis glucosyltransferase MdoH [Leptospira soteropolitanensis]MCW7492489.1 glucans biosynthesis glucosyltransferase MdoH [Leptospira soteropolitanensis]MCW7500539.1 glucans biosynthesis glucosyltransferase MdoH [Leptospira soteropolitanensis]MCW7522791.1 glucans biosynthesis glucosyltransferase MdoH [Leptospira soteropolitanensis]MCW7526649.1 glucans biosynthesis glucosyltransferase MdoH [Leptospira soteropolitanensis]MCW7530509.1 glucans biosynthesis glucosyltransferase MdoH
MIHIHRTLFFLTFVTPVLIGFSLFIDIISFRGIEIPEYYQFITLIFLLPMLSYGASTALFGFILSQKKNADSLLKAKRIPTKELDFKLLESINVAVVMPVYEENEISIFSRIKVIFTSVEKIHKLPKLDFFILSDTRTPEKWIKEEAAYIELCESTNNFHNFHYRRRKSNLNGKSGNIADFCRRWGKQYKYMIILDADSLVSGDLIIQLIANMEKNPNAGIIQSGTKIFRTTTLFQKLTEFSSYLFSPFFLKGANFWQIDSSGYWGHNAILRVKPFMEHCALPHLPEYGGLGGKILSHDTVEAALMRKAGFEVLCAYELEGSYEENPPNIIDTLKRDQRWCQGNLQHFWFLFGKKIPLINRIHILNGILSYLNSPIWMCYIILSLWNYLEDSKYLNYSMLPEEYEFFKSQIYDPLYIKLLYLSILLLFLPRILSYISLPLLQIIKKFPAFLLETLFSILIAPIYMIYHSIFVFSILLNKRISWGPQNRDANSEYNISYIISSFFGVTILGFACAYISYSHSTMLFLLTLPIWIGWISAIPLVILTGKEFKSLNKILSISFWKPDKQLIGNLEEELKTHKNSYLEGRELFFALVHPVFHNRHKQLQGNKLYSSKLPKTIEENFSILLKRGPEFLEKKTLLKILSNRELLDSFYWKFWTSKKEDWGNYWKTIWEEINPSFFPSISNNKKTDSSLR